MSSTSFNAADTRHRSVIAWLDAFAAAVRRKDIEAGRAMFAPDVLGFGSVTVRAEGIDRLIEDQWRNVWPVTRDFAFDASNLLIGGDGRTSWIAAQWSSFGRRADGVEFRRSGRVTIVLEEVDGTLLARHTHFSLEPAPRST